MCFIQNPSLFYGLGFVFVLCSCLFLKKAIVRSIGRTFCKILTTCFYVNDKRAVFIQHFFFLCCGGNMGGGGVHRAYISSLFDLWFSRGREPTWSQIMMSVSMSISLYIIQNIIKFSKYYDNNKPPFCCFTSYFCFLSSFEFNRQDYTVVGRNF